MRLLPVLFLIAMALAGCSSSSSDEGTVTPGSGVATNPGGKPRTDEEANRANQMSQTGNKMNDDRAAAAAAMAKARGGTGGQ